MVERFLEKWGSENFHTCLVQMGGGLRTAPDVVSDTRRVLFGNVTVYCEHLWDALVAVAIHKAWIGILCHR
jgi:hypothetical protein